MTARTTKTKEDKPFRILTPSGYRKYLCDGLYLPSVTTVLSATESENQSWSEEMAAEQSWWPRSCCCTWHINPCCFENYLRGLPIDVPEEYMQFWNCMDQYLEWIDELYWSERPLRPDWNHLRSDDKEVAYVWSTVHQFAGCPDLVGTIGGVNVIADFKTSNTPYRTSYPERGDSGGYGGFRKYQKVAQQMAAYRLALEERTGFHCDVALVIVTTPETTQGIFIDGDQLDLYESRFIKRCQMFHAQESSEFEAKVLSIKAQN